MDEYVFKLENERNSQNDRLTQFELENDIIIADNHNLKVEIKKQASTIAELEKRLAESAGTQDPLVTSHAEIAHAKELQNIQLDSDLQRANSIIESLRKELSELKNKASDVFDDRKVESGSMANLTASKVANIYKIRETIRQSTANLPFSFCAEDLAGSKLRPVRVATPPGVEKPADLPGLDRQLESSQAVGVLESTLMGRWG